MPLINIVCLWLLQVFGIIGSKRVIKNLIFEGGVSENFVEYQE